MSGAVAKTKRTTAHAIRSSLNTGSMTFAVRDASGRMIEFYEANLSAEDGTPCLLTEFKYTDGPAGTSRDVLGTKESIVEWLAAYDFDGLP